MKNTLTKSYNLIRWAIIFGAISVSSYFAYLKGLPQIVVSHDATGISVAIMAVTLLGTFYVGSVSKRLDSGVLGKKTLGRPMKILNYLSDVCFPLGLLGTAVGFCMMMYSALGTTKDVAEIINMLKAGISTALYTTAFGLIGTLLLWGQIFVIDLFNLTEDGQGDEVKKEVLLDKGDSLQTEFAF